MHCTGTRNLLESWNLRKYPSTTAITGITLKWQYIAFFRAYLDTILKALNEICKKFYLILGKKKSVQCFDNSIWHQNFCKKVQKQCLLTFHLFQLMPVVIHSMKGLSLPCHQLNVKSRFQINGTMYSVTNMEELKHEMKRVDLLCHQHQENRCVNNVIWVGRQILRLNIWYRGFLPYANFISVNFITGIF